MEYQTCKRCGRVDGYDFLVPDECWEQIAGPYKDKALCFLCFDELAHDAGLWWDASSLSFMGKRGKVSFSKEARVLSLEKELRSLEQENTALREQVERLRCAAGPLAES